MYKAVWGVKDKPIRGNKIAETENSWSLPIIHKAIPGEEEDYFVDITPRNLQFMKVKQGEIFNYEIKNLDGSEIVIDYAKFANGDMVKNTFKKYGVIIADKHDLLLVPNVPISKAGCIVKINRIKK
jgi:hypothetical protein